MRVRSSKNEQKKPNSVDKLMGYTQKSYRSFQDYVQFRDDDPIWMMAYKIGFRFVGILFFLALSPFLLFALLVAVMVAV